jgi:hypothetical protein
MNCTHCRHVHDQGARTSGEVSPNQVNTLSGCEGYEPVYERLDIFNGRAVWQRQ